MNKTRRAAADIYIHIMSVIVTRATWSDTKYSWNQQTLVRRMCQSSPEKVPIWYEMRCHLWHYLVDQYVSLDLHLGASITMSISSVLATHNLEKLLKTNLEEIVMDDQGWITRERRWDRGRKRANISVREENKEEKGSEIKQRRSRGRWGHGTRGRRGWGRWRGCWYSWTLPIRCHRLRATLGIQPIRHRERIPVQAGAMQWHHTTHLRLLQA